MPDVPAGERESDDQGERRQSALLSKEEEEEEEEDEDEEEEEEEEEGGGYGSRRPSVEFKACKGDALQGDALHGGRSAGGRSARGTLCRGTLCTGDALQGDALQDAWTRADTRTDAVTHISALCPVLHVQKINNICQHICPLQETEDAGGRSKEKKGNVHAERRSRANFSNEQNQSEARSEAKTHWVRVAADSGPGRTGYARTRRRATRSSPSGDRGSGTAAGLRGPAAPPRVTRNSPMCLKHIYEELLVRRGAEDKVLNPRRDLTARVLRSGTAAGGEKPSSGTKSRFPARAAGAFMVWFAAGMGGAAVLSSPVRVPGSVGACAFASEDPARTGGSAPPAAGKYGLKRSRRQASAAEHATGLPGGTFTIKTLAPGGSWWLLEAPGGSWWLLVAPSGSWCLLVAHNVSWWLLVAPGGAWRLLVAPGGSWCLLVAPGGSWRLLVSPGGSWRLLVSLGRSWWLPVAPGGSWWLLVSPGGS
ncbi:unnamed protein product [Pleuronectes platessa]|uniref:Uncharacterized protein n=1 Tax=Pleuronectes platessa TaxID=8262 RepID=A0A9N7W0I6_PLEPL|nr:unnamed protein product [Pleuronectes platessa]